MNRALTYAAGSAWFSVVFTVVFYYTFPSEAVAQRLEYEVDKATGGTTSIEISDVAPWWFGLSGRNFILSRAEAGMGGEPAPAFFADAISMRVSMFSLLRRAPFITAALEMEDAVLGVEASTVLEEGRMKVRRIKGELSDFSLEQILQIGSDALSVSFEGSGAFQVSFDLKMGPSDDLSTASGEVAVVSSDLKVDRVLAPNLGFPEQTVGLSVEEFDFRLRGEGGALSVVRGAMRSNLFDVDAEGDVTLGDIPGRSRLKLGVKVGLGAWDDPELAVLRQGLEFGMRDAKWEDETYHYTVNAQLNRLALHDFRPDRERSSRAVGRATDAGVRSTSEPPPDFGAPPTPPVRPADVARRPGSGFDRDMPGAVPEGEEEEVIEEEEELFGEEEGGGEGGEVEELGYQE
jgi:type II secretion system protein N